MPMKAADVMTTEIVSVGPETSVRHIAQLMLRHRISAVPVLDDEGKLAGIVSEGDLMRRAELGRDRHRSWWLNLLAGPEEIANEYVKQHGQRARDVMTSRVISIEENTSVATIAAILEEKRVKRLPVLKDGRLIGIVSRADLLHAIATAELDQSASGDEAIRRAVRTRIRHDAGVRDSTLSVTVSDGVVHLWGAVGSAAERRAAEVAAESVHGVCAVVDHTSLLLEKSWGIE
jgi:CBS domain-containing protein